MLFRSSSYPGLRRVLLHPDCCTSPSPDIPLRSPRLVQPYRNALASPSQKPRLCFSHLHSSAGVSTPQLLVVRLKPRALYALSLTDTSLSRSASCLAQTRTRPLRLGFPPASTLNSTQSVPPKPQVSTTNSCSQHHPKVADGVCPTATSFRSHALLEFSSL